jgi:hypothetical protein
MLEVCGYTVSICILIVVFVACNLSVGAELISPLVFIVHALFLALLSFRFLTVNDNLLVFCLKKT